MLSSADGSVPARSRVSRLLQYLGVVDEPLEQNPRPSRVALFGVPGGAP